MKEEIQLILNSDKLSSEQKVKIIKEMVKNQNWYPYWYWPYYPYDTHTPPGIQDVQVPFVQETQPHTASPYRVEFANSDGEKYTYSSTGNLLSTTIDNGDGTETIQPNPGLFEIKLARMPEWEKYTTIKERDAIPEVDRYIGMRVKVNSDEYVLLGGVLNNNWIKE